MTLRAIQRAFFAMALAGLCVAAKAQDGGNGSVLIRDGNGSAISNEDGGVRVSAAAMAAQILSRPDPQYPFIAGKTRISGSVVIAVKVDKDGKVAKATAISGPEPLRDAALEAVRRYTYKPYLLNGQAVMVSTTVAVVFYPGR